MNGHQASSAGHDDRVAAGIGKQQQAVQPSMPASNGNQPLDSVSVGSGRAALREVGSTMVISVYLPELEIRRRHEIDVDENLWSAKIRLLALLDNNGPRDGLNCSFYLPPANGRAGKFLDDERPLRDYPLSAGDLMLEFKHKRRIYRQPTVSFGKLRRLHTRENLKHLLSAVKACALDKVGKLLAKGLDPNFQDAESGETPLTTAVTLSDCHSMVTTLVGGGCAHLDFRNRQSLTPMHVAAACGNAVAITVLLELGASPNSKDRKGLTPLFYVCASRLGSVPCAELLLRDYAAIGCQDQLGYTELHQACKNGHLHLAEMLVLYGADMNARNADGWTPLHSCVAANQIPCLKMLLHRGANGQVVDLSSQTPLQAARLLSKAEAAAVLEAHNDSLVRPFTEPPQYSQRRRLTGTNLEVLRRLAESDARLSASSASLLNRDSLSTAATLNATAPRSSSMSRSFHSGSVRSGRDGDFEYDDMDDDGLDQWATGPRSSLGHLSLYLPRERRSLTNELNEVLGVRNEDVHWGRSSRSSTNGGSSSNFKETVAGDASVATPSMAVSPERRMPSMVGAAAGAVSPSGGGPGAATEQHTTSRPSANVSSAAQLAASMGATPPDDGNGRIKAVVLSKGKKGFGFVLRGAKAAQLKKLEVAFEPTDRMPALQYLDSVEAGSVAEKAGLKAGDFIAEINGVDVTCMSHEDLVQLIKACGASLSMKVISPGLVPDHLDKTLASYESPTPAVAPLQAPLGSSAGLTPSGKPTAAVPATYATLPLASAKPAPVTATSGAASGGAGAVGVAANDLPTAAGLHAATQRQLQAATLSASAAAKVASIRSRPSSQLFVTSAEMENIMASGALPLPAAMAAEGQPRDSSRMPPPPPPPRGGSSSTGATTGLNPSSSAAATSRLSSASSGGSSSAADLQQRLPHAGTVSSSGAGSRRPSASGSAASWHSGNDAGDASVSASAGNREHAGSGTSRLTALISTSVASRSSESPGGSTAAAARAVAPEYSVVFIPPAPGHPPPAVPQATGSTAGLDAERSATAKGFLPRTQLPQRDSATAAILERGGGGSHGMSMLLPPPPPPPPPMPQLLPPGDAAAPAGMRIGQAKVAIDVKPRKDGTAIEEGAVAAGTSGRDDSLASFSSRSSSVGSATSLTCFGENLRNAVAAVAERRNGSLTVDESATVVATRLKAGREELDRATAVQAGGPSLDVDLQKALQKRQAALVTLEKAALPNAMPILATAAVPLPASGVSAPGGGAIELDSKGAEATAEQGGSRGRVDGSDSIAAPAAVPAAEPEGAPFTEMAERVRTQWLAARKADQQQPQSSAAASSVQVQVAPAPLAMAGQPAKKPPPPPVPVKKVTVRMEHHSPTKRVSGPVMPQCFPLPPSAEEISGAAAAAGSDIRLLLGPNGTAGQHRPGSGNADAGEPLANDVDDLELPPPPPPAAFDGASFGEDGEQQDSAAVPPLPPPPPSFNAAAVAASEPVLQPLLQPTATPNLESGDVASVPASLATAAAGDVAAAAGLHVDQAASGDQALDKDLSYIEKRVDAWSVADVGNWLEGHGLGEYRAAFADNCVDGESLVNLTREDVKELGLEKVGHRVKFEKEVKKLAYFLTSSTSDA